MVTSSDAGKVVGNIMPLSLETHGQFRVGVCEIDRGCGESDTWKSEDVTFTALRIITHILKHNV